MHPRPSCVFKVAGTVLLIIALHADAYAESRFAFNVGVNHSNADTIRIGGQTGTTMDSTVSGTSARLGISADVTAWLGVDAGWARLGSAHGTVSVFAVCIPEAPDCPDFVFDVRQDGTAYWIAITPAVQRGDFRLFGKLGAGRTSREIGVPGSMSRRWKETETEVLVGAGVRKAMTRNFGLRLDYERMGGVAQNVGISVEYRF